MIVLQDKKSTEFHAQIPHHSSQNYLQVDHQPYQEEVQHQQGEEVEEAPGICFKTQFTALCSCCQNQFVEK